MMEPMEEPASTTRAQEGKQTKQAANAYAVDMDDQTSETCSTVSSNSVEELKIKNKLATISLQDEDDEEADAHEKERLLQENHLTSDVRTFANTIIAFLGSGVLGLPYAFKKCGILMGLVTLITVATISTYTMLLVVQCKYKLKAQGQEITKYGEIGYFAMGKIGSVLVDVSLVISQTSFCVAYLIFIASNANKFLDIPKEVVVALCVGPLMGFSMLKHMKELAYVALLADCMNFMGLAVVYWTDLSYMTLDHDTIDVVGAFSSVPFFFGIASYCFEGVGMVLPLENSMQTKSNFTPILISTVVIITSIYATFGICGYLAFGDATQDVITLNFENNGDLAMMAKLFLCAGLFFTYPVMLFPVFEVLQSLLFSGGKEGEYSREATEKKMILVRATIVLITAIIAAGVPSFGRFISFIGSTCCSLLAFVLPSYFYLQLFRDDPLTIKTTLKRMLLCAILLVGVAALVTGIYEGIISLIDKDDN